MEPKGREKRAQKPTWKRERQRAHGFYICFSIFYFLSSFKNEISQPLFIQKASDAELVLKLIMEI